jgi:histidinol-phosphate phosphatase family protein
MISVCVIAGGKGTRSINPSVPKSLHLIDGKPLIWHQLQCLNRFNAEVTFVLGFGARDIIEFIQEHMSLYKNLKINFIIESGSRGTLGAYKDFLVSNSANDTLVILGDLFFDFDVNNFYLQHIFDKAELSIVTHPNDHPHDSDLILVDFFNDKVLDFYEKGQFNHSGLQGNSAIAGIYLVKNAAIEYLKVNSGDFSSSIIKYLLKNSKQVNNFTSTEYIKDTGTPTRIKEVSDYVNFKKNESQILSCIFLDLDNTLIPNLEIKKNCDSPIIPAKTKDIIHKINTRSIPLIICSNQPGIAKNFFSESDMNSFIRNLQFELSQCKAFINDWFICPHHPEKGWPHERHDLKVICRCRKPETGLFKKAQKRHRIIFDKSIYIGDQESDRIVAKSLGINFFMVKDYTYLPETLNRIVT